MVKTERRNYRFNPDTAAKIARLSVRLGITETKVIEKLVDRETYMLAQLDGPLTFETVQDGTQKILYVNLGSGSLAEAVALMLEARYAGHYIRRGQAILYYTATDEQGYRDMIARVLCQ